MTTFPVGRLAVDIEVLMPRMAVSVTNDVISTTSRAPLNFTNDPYVYVAAEAVLKVCSSHRSLDGTARNDITVSLGVDHRVSTPALGAAPGTLEAVCSRPSCRSADAST